jgi:fluoride exporter
MHLLWIALGGAVGTLARYLLGTAALRLLGTGFPFGTIAINAIGSFLLAIVAYLGLTRDVISPELRTILGTGLLGGFTTYSSFNQETLALFQRGSPVLAAANVLATVVLCLLAGGLGLVLARTCFGR